MKRFVTHLSLLAAGAMVATGCVPTRHNLPPEQHLMEPGPGVGGPGPGVLGPQPYYGATGTAGGPVGGLAKVESPADVPSELAEVGSEIKQVGYVEGFDGDAACSCGSGCNDGSCSTSGGRTAGCFGGGPGIPIPPGGGVLGAGGGGAGGMMAPVPQAVQVTFARPEGMQVRYDQAGGGYFDSDPLIVPARQNFPQGGLYRVKLTNIPDRQGLELYPTIELAFANPRTGAYLAHNSIPIQFDDEDFDQVVTGNFVTKVLYLPDPDFQGPALAGIDTLVSTRLDPGIDPIVEADRRGSILAIIRLGDKDIEMPGSGFDGVGAIAPPIAGLPTPFAMASTEGCGPAGAGNYGGNCSPLPPQLPGMVAGVTAPQYGMPMSGTPIGLPGPPHIPLGTPAGLKKHVMKNHTPMHIPQPVEKLKMSVRHQPGYSYPNPVSRVHITEQNIHPGVPLGRGLYQHQSQSVDPNCQP
ncbi:hypothetical protein FYK55_20550 [Roseiconus nitratireducens]|uniref:Uncharacterized protein n=1 Tax=Roseiconus nitratireducens TaxID=2605748 RepID=A0A5M6D3V2_9BACT|nr:hypothetical protein [Roseiconus nitratireducens]KAA5540409.1 hypothetical protein FYK55_20550 [Roseiconus nitratireducens]